MRRDRPSGYGTGYEVSNPWKCTTLQRHNTENSKQLFPEKEMRYQSPNSYILPILLQENRWTDRGEDKLLVQYNHMCIGRQAYSNGETSLYWLVY
jgi:hypothetical protein